MEYYCAKGNNELEQPPGSEAEWKEQNQENIVGRDGYTVAQLNVMDFSTSSNAMILNYPEELMRKKTTSGERTKGVEMKKEKHMIDHVVWWGFWL